jgi:hypothetical protein
MLNAGWFNCGNRSNASIETVTARQPTNMPEDTLGITNNSQENAGRLPMMNG